MQRISLFLILALFSLPLLASNTEGNNPENAEAKETNSSTLSSSTVINAEMIAKFNDAEYSSKNLSINNLLSNYNFEEIKKIAKAHIHDGLDVNNADEIANVINKTNDNKLQVRETPQLYSELIEE